MTITPSYFRKNLYKILDQVAATGVSPEIKRKGVALRIVADGKLDPFLRLKKYPNVMAGNPEDIVHSDWSSDWHNALP